MSGRNQRRTLGAGAMLSVVTLLWLPYALAASQAIESSIELEQGLPAKLADVQRGSKFSAQNLAGKSDVQLTQLTAQWGQLTPSQRRDLLAEVRRRMTLNKASAAAPKDGLKTGQKGGKVTIRVQRRYGRLGENTKGTVVVQTRVVKVRPRVAQVGTVRVDKVQTASHKGRSQVTFGIGFEQRSKTRSAQPNQTQPDPSLQESSEPASAASVSIEPAEPRRAP